MYVLSTCVCCVLCGTGAVPSRAGLQSALLPPVAGAIPGGHGTGGGLERAPSPAQLHAGDQLLRLRPGTLPGTGRGGRDTETPPDPAHVGDGGGGAESAREEQSELNYVRLGYPPG